MVWMGQNQRPGAWITRAGDWSVARPDVVRAVRRQLASGAYDLPAEDLVDRLVSVVIARHAPSSAEPGR